MTFPCDDLEIWIERFRDGDLSGRELRDARRHLARCGSCRSRLEELDQIGSTLRDALASADLPLPPADLAQRISQRVAALPQPPPRAAVPVFHPWSLAMAAAVAGFVLVFSLLWLDRRHDGTMFAGKPEEAPVRVELPSDAPESPPVRLVGGSDPEWQVVWIGGEEPRP